MLSKKKKKNIYDPKIFHQLNSQTIMEVNFFFNLKNFYQLQPFYTTILFKLKKKKKIGMEVNLE